LLIRYVVQEMLGQGTFGQVAKCWDAETNNYVAVKVIKNQPAFYQQAIMEVSLLSLVRYFNVHSSIYFCWMHGKIWLSTVTIISPAVKQEIWSWWSTPHCPNAGFFPLPKSFVYSLWDAWSQPVRWLSFNYVHQSSVFHSWSDINLHFYRYELLKRNSLRGLQMKYVRTFSRQVCCHLNMLNGSLMYLLQYVMCILFFSDIGCIDSHERCWHYSLWSKTRKHPYSSEVSCFLSVSCASVHQSCSLMTTWWLLQC